jgi:hypothetical protein
MVCRSRSGGAKEKAAAEAFGAELKNLDIPRIIKEMMEAVAYGYSPIEKDWANMKRALRDTAPLCDLLQTAVYDYLC